jgi:hypothetical protein
MLAVAACQVGAGTSDPAGPAPPPGDGRPELLVGAHYYLWFPSRFQAGTYLRSRLAPAQQPLLGEYASSSPAVVERHIAWASAHGIDFFTLDWWPGATEHNALIERSVLAARNVSWMRYCIFYELGALGYDAVAGVTRFDQARADRFVADMDQIAARYFEHPRYLRVDGRPVIVLYITRTATGRFAEAMARFRARMSERGVDPFVIGDEIFWTVARADGAGDSTDPQRERIALFDAVTAYNLYDPTRAGHVGYGAAGTLLSDAHALYELYRGLGGRPVVPLALPGYNDRAFRPEAAHDAIPREWAAGAGEGSFFAKWLEHVALPLVDARLPMMLVTSWNEWSEDTAIEPAAPAPATARDRSPSGSAFTQGYAYGGYETRYLEVLKQQLDRVELAGSPARLPGPDAVRAAVAPRAVSGPLAPPGTRTARDRTPPGSPPSARVRSRPAP